MSFRVSNDRALWDFRTAIGFKQRKRISSISKQVTTRTTSPAGSTIGTRRMLRCDAWLLARERTREDDSQINVKMSCREPSVDSGSNAEWPEQFATHPQPLSLNSTIASDALMLCSLLMFTNLLLTSMK